MSRNTPLRRVHAVQKEGSTTTPPRVLSSTSTLPQQQCGERRIKKREECADEGQEQVLKFLIGLRLLGEKKQQRFLAYMRSVQESSENGQTSSQKEGEHGI